MIRNGRIALLLLMLTLTACNLPTAKQPVAEAPAQPLPEETAALESQPSATTAPPDQPVSSPTEAMAVVHLVSPGNIGEFGVLNYDVESSGTGPQKRAPFGDSYKSNLLERPFDQEMNYLPDLDVRTFSLVANDAWHYLSIELIGSNPNNELGLRYGAVLDTDKDGYGNFLIWAAPPYTAEWTAANVQVFADSNRDSAGRSASASDAPFEGDGYETLIFDLNQGIGEDVDLVWVRLVGPNVIQLAFKSELTGPQFLFGAITDAGLRDPGRMDYVDFFSEAQAGSPVRDSQYYPQKELYAVDTTCNAAFGFVPTGYEPKICPRIVPAAGPVSSGNSSDSTPSAGMCPTPEGGSCSGSTPIFWPYPHCACSSEPYNP